MNDQIGNAMRYVIRLTFAAALVVAYTTGFIPYSAAAQDGIRAPLCFWEGLSWDEMRPAEKKAWMVLGWNRARWESEDDISTPPSVFKDWIELNRVEQTALKGLGFGKTSWDTFDADTCTEIADGAPPMTIGSSPPTVEEGSAGILIKSPLDGVTVITSTPSEDAGQSGSGE